jgi:glycosyltransferase involved in cell wall biosynthesis
VFWRFFILFRMIPLLNHKEIQLMKIAMISTPFLSVPPRGYGGTELVIYELVEGLIANGHDVTLFSTGDACSSAKLRYFYDVPIWPPAPLPDVYHVTASIAEVIHEGDFDVIHTHSVFALAYARLFPDLPLVYTLHHAQDRELSEFYQKFPDVYYIAISRNQKRMEVPMRRCDVIHHGLDPTRYDWAEVPGDYVCFIGRFAEVKGPHTAIDVAEKAGLRIQVAGEIHSVDDAFAQREVIPRLKKPHVDFLGCLGAEGKVPFFMFSRALLAPLGWEEPFGLFMIEAMLSGCPVIGFSRGSVPELVDHGVTGFIVSSEDEMADVIRPGGILDSFDRRRCRERAVMRFSRERMVLDHERTYSKVAHQSTAPMNLKLPLQRI